MDNSGSKKEIDNGLGSHLDGYTGTSEDKLGNRVQVNDFCSAYRRKINIIKVTGAFLAQLNLG